MMIARKLLFFGLTISLSTFAAVNRDFKIPIEKKVRMISKEISSIENNLGSGNKRYLKTFKERKSLESRIVTLERQLSVEKRILINKKKKIEKTIRQIIVQRLSPGTTPSFLVSSKLIFTGFKKDLSIINKSILKNKKTQKELEKKKKYFNDLRNIESEILSAIYEMEEVKKLKSNKYLSLLEQKKELEKLKVLKKFKTTRKAKKRKKTGIISERFQGPIDDILDLEYGKKGVTFKFNKKQRVKNSRKGKVIYTGTLSTYGNVVMIEHGNDLKSVYLGQFQPNVKKGRVVNAGQSIGNTFEVSKNEGKLYFEVRKKNKAQNTVRLLNKDILAKFKRKKSPRV